MQISNNRLESLHYLRGIAALCIMLYHYIDWTISNYSSQDFFGRIGLYLIHPLAFTFTKMCFGKIGYDTINPVIIISIISTLIISYFSYQYFEKFFIKFGKKEQRKVLSVK